MYAEKLLWLVAVKGVALFQALVHESLRIRLSGLIGVIHWVYIVAPQLMNMDLLYFLCPANFEL